MIVIRGPETTRDTNSRTDLWLRSARTAVLQSAIKRSRSNMARPSLFCELCDRPDGASRRLGAVTLLMKIIRPVEFENKVSVNGRRVAGRVIGAGANGSALDDRVRVGTVE